MADAFPATRAGRQAAIARIIGSSIVASQAELRDHLSKMGIETTQATVSRDLLEMRATKVRGSSGQMKYVIPEAGAPGQVSLEPATAEAGSARLSRWCQDLLVTADVAVNQVILRTPAGAAQLLAAAIDSAVIPEILGSIAGDDTVLLVCHDHKTAKRLCKNFLRLAEPNRDA